MFRLFGEAPHRDALRAATPGLSERSALMSDGRLVTNGTSATHFYKMLFYCFWEEEISVGSQRAGFASL